jgi:hypothetical protein
VEGKKAYFELTQIIGHLQLSLFTQQELVFPKRLVIGLKALWGEIPKHLIMLKCNIVTSR